MYIGIIITAQAFQVTPRAHAPAVAISLFPAMAAIILVTLGCTSNTPASACRLAQIVQNPTPETMYLPGLLALTGANSGWIVVTLVLTAIGVAMIEHKYRTAAVWAAAATVLTVIGATHAYRLEGNVVREYFIWQKVDCAHLQTSPTSAPPPTATTSQPATVAYRAYPIAVGYGLATVLFALAAMKRRDEDEDKPAERVERPPILPPVRPEPDLPPIPLVDDDAEAPRPFG